MSKDPYWIRHPPVGISPSIISLEDFNAILQMGMKLAEEARKELPEKKNG